MTEPPATTLDANLIAGSADGGRIAQNIIHFARVLRAAGLRIGTAQTLAAVEAVMAAGVRDPATLYWTLHAVFVTRRGDRETFAQAFHLVWRDPGFLNQMLSMMMPQMKAPRQPQDKPLSRRVTDSLLGDRPQRAAPREDMLEVDAAGTFSTETTIRTKDFEQMSAAELALARREIARLSLPLEEIVTRRYRPDRAGTRLDLRRILRDTASRGADHIALHRLARHRRRPPVVVLVDISGSMDAYARIFLHFLHALTNDRDRVSAFLFGTRLAHVTRSLKARDPDAAISKIARDVTDWSGGTRIGACLHAFNRDWARRVLGQNALVLLFTDGLDREGGEVLAHEARRLRASCRRLVWLNPLLRYDGYAPAAAGAAALAPHVSELRACHTLESLADLTRALSA